MSIEHERDKRRRRSEGRTSAMKSLQLEFRLSERRKVIGSIIGYKHFTPNGVVCLFLPGPWLFCRCDDEFSNTRNDN